MKPKSIPDDYVRIATCRFCGGKTNTILLHKQLKSIPKDQALDPNPCDACEERFKTMCFFVADCGHSGFIKNTVLEERINSPELTESILMSKIFRMEKCFFCMSGQEITEEDRIPQSNP